MSCYLHPFVSFGKKGECGFLKEDGKYFATHSVDGEEVERLPLTDSFPELAKRIITARRINMPSTKEELDALEKQIDAL